MPSVEQTIDWLDGLARDGASFQPRDVVGKYDCHNADSKAAEADTCAEDALDAVRCGRQQDAATAARRARAACSAAEGHARRAQEFASLSGQPVDVEAAHNASMRATMASAKVARAELVCGVTATDGRADQPRDEKGRFTTAGGNSFGMTVPGVSGTLDKTKKWSPEEHESAAGILRNHSKSLRNNAGLAAHIVKANQKSFEKYDKITREMAMSKVRPDRGQVNSAWEARNRYGSEAHKYKKEMERLEKEALRADQDANLHEVEAENKREWAASQGK